MMKNAKMRWSKLYQPVRVLEILHSKYKFYDTTVWLIDGSITSSNLKTLKIITEDKHSKIIRLYWSA